MLFYFPFMNKSILIFLFASIQMFLSCKQPKRQIVPTNPLKKLHKLQTKYGIDNFYNSFTTFNINQELTYSVERRNNISNYIIHRETNNKSYKGTYENGHIEYFVNDTLQDDSSYNRLFLDVKLDAFIHTIGIPSTLNTNDLIIKEKNPVIIRNKLYDVLYITTKQDKKIAKDEYYIYYDTNSYLIRYIALNHSLTNPYRPVFRKMINHREINSVIFSDFYSFVPKSDNTPIENLYTEFNNVNLKQVETIIFQNIKVTLFE